MEKQIKEEANETSLCFDTSRDNLASLTLLEKYDRFIQNYSSDADSDGDLFPDDTMIREEYAQLRVDTAKHTTTAAKNLRLSTEIPGRSRRSDSSHLSVVDDDATNGTIQESMAELGSTKAVEEQSGLISLNELIEKLELIRKCGEGGNSIFCTESELKAFQDSYGGILDFLREKSSTFERSNSKDSDNHQDEDNEDEDEEVDVQVARENETNNNNITLHIDEDQKLLADKMELVQQARDKFYEVEQQVREQLEQLELVERYKMESVG